ncbi:Rad17 cell cycle checkpoint protein-domain-containing protein [Chiua virens]|nr:Rad17 cell cycle checkpoint protein-domain-containing protein [Chiua virens]
MSRKPPSKSTPSTSNKNSKKPLKTLKLARYDSDHDSSQPPTKKHRAGFSLSNTPVFDFANEDTIMMSSSQGSMGSRPAKPILQSQRPVVDVKGKHKETRSFTDREYDTLWVDKYEPTTEAELAVHKRKVEDVRRWLLEALEGGPSTKLRKYRRILALTGPAGTAKTSTLRVLSRELDFEILEWRNSMSERGPSAFTNEDAYPDGSLVPSSSQSQSSVQRSGKRQVVLLEDLPNLLHQPTQARFQAALRSLCIPSSKLSEPGPPIIIIVSDSGLRAEQPDDDVWEGGSNGRRWGKKEVLDIRNVLGSELLTSPYVTCIGFNPIAPTLMTKVLQALLSSHFGSLDAHERQGKQPSREVVDLIVGSSNGDIRSAIMALQFACVVDLPASSLKSKGKATRKTVSGTKKTTNVRVVLEAITRREQSLVLFHLMGKILYNKRKFDPPASHLSTKGAAKERELDMQLSDPPPLPGWLSHHDRKASRVCIETLSVESPIDSSLLGLYTHQNYTQFCTDIDQCAGVCEGLSWVDWMGGALSANSPYAFPALTLSTLHSLPTPVPRRGQKACKPIWFDMRTKELEAWDAVGDVLGWLGKGVEGVDSHTHEDLSTSSSISVGNWTHATVATELGGWLTALDRGASQVDGKEAKRATSPATTTDASTVFASSVECWGCWGGYTGGR